MEAVELKQTEEANNRNTTPITRTQTIATARQLLLDTIDVRHGSGSGLAMSTWLRYRFAPPRPWHDTPDIGLSFLLQVLREGNNPVLQSNVP